jgi:SAM-dependent methyltransferase
MTKRFPSCPNSKPYGSFRPPLDIGCAFGVAVLEALERGATVIANDISDDHLRYIKRAAPQRVRSRLTTVLGYFPRDLEFREASLASVHASNLFNFLTGQEIEEGAAKIAHWLVPGGKIFIIAGTPYADNIKGFISTYEARRRSGVRWPGECEKLSDYSDDPTILELPEFLHLLDDVVLRRTFEEAGLHVDESFIFHRRHTPRYISYDGRENVCIVATKR